MLTESDFAPLLQAVPSYAPQWARDREDAPPESIAFEITMWLAVHLADRLAAGDETELGAFFEALDRLYRMDNPEMDDQLTVGLLESFIYAAERRGVNLSRISTHITGSEALAGWEAAYAYTHAGREDEVP